MHPISFARFNALANYCRDARAIHWSKNTPGMNPKTVGCASEEVLKPPRLLSKRGVSTRNRPSERL